MTTSILLLLHLIGSRKSTLKTCFFVVHDHLENRRARLFFFAHTNKKKIDIHGRGREGVETIWMFIIL